MGSPGLLICPIVNTGVSVNIERWDYYKSIDGTIIETINERYIYCIHLCSTYTRVYELDVTSTMYIYM